MLSGHITATQTQGHDKQAQNCTIVFHFIFLLQQFRELRYSLPNVEYSSTYEAKCKANVIIEDECKGDDY